MRSGGGGGGGGGFGGVAVRGAALANRGSVAMVLEGRGSQEEGRTLKVVGFGNRSRGLYLRQIWGCLAGVYFGKRVGKMTKGGEKM